MTSAQKKALRKLSISVNCEGMNCFESDTLDPQLQNLIDTSLAAGGNYFKDLQAKKDRGEKLTSFEEKSLAIYNKGLEAEGKVTESATHSAVGEFVTENMFAILASLVGLFFVLRYFFGSK